MAVTIAFGYAREIPCRLWLPITSAAAQGRDSLGVAILACHFVSAEAGEQGKGSEM